MNKNFWLGFIVGILVLVLGFLIFGKETEAPTENVSDNVPENANEAPEIDSRSTTTNTIWNGFDGEIGI